MSRFPCASTFRFCGFYTPVCPELIYLDTSESSRKRERIISEYGSFKTVSFLSSCPHVLFPVMEDNHHAALRCFQGCYRGAQARSHRRGAALCSGSSKHASPAAAPLLQLQSRRQRRGRQGGAGRLARVDAVQPSAYPPVRRATDHRRDLGSVRWTMAKRVF